MPSDTSEVARPPHPVGSLAAVELRQVECFLAVAEHLHFAKAAEQLHLGQTTVSEAIRRLETELGGALFSRTTRRVTLTPLGERFLEDARPAVASLTMAYDRARALAATGAPQLRVGYCYDDERPLLLGLVRDLQRAQPGVMVDFRPLSTAAQMAQLHAGGLDVCLCYVPVLDETVEVAEVGETSIVALVPAGHAFARAGSTTLAAMAAEPLVVFPRAGNPNLYDLFAAAMERTGRPWRVVATADDVENLAARALSGVGVSVALAAAIGTAPVEGVVAVPVRDAPPVTKMLVWRRRHESDAVDDFTRLAVARLRDAVSPIR
jgi:DNA-binding transcriptional LysR family regulator